MANFNDLTLLERDDTPSLPMAGKMKIYAKTDKNIYKLDSDGIETLLGSAGPPAPDEGLFGWGWNGGDGRNGQDPRMPLFCVSEDEFSMVSIGSGFALGIKANGTLWAKGNNGSGRTGLNTSSGYSFQWQQIGTDTNWSICSAGSTHSAAIKTDGTLWTWGSRSNGALGDGNTTGSTIIPTQIGSDTNWTSVSCGSSFTCAVKGGQLLAAGSNANFRTGLNTSTGNTTTFTVANSNTDWLRVYAGLDYALALKGSPVELWSFGANQFGKTGHSITSGSTQIPTQIGSLTGWTNASAGFHHSAAIRNGLLYTFGNGGNGKLGHNNTTQYTSPTQVGSDSDWLQVSVFASTLANEYEFTIAIKGGMLYGTGQNTSGQIGQDLTTTESLVFVQIGDGTNYTFCSAGGACGMAIRKNP